jgi:nitrogen fixation-related uncharacterized protein
MPSIYGLMPINLMMMIVRVFLGVFWGLANKVFEKVCTETTFM